MTTTKTPEQEANELVEMFRPYADRGIEDSSRFEIESAVEISILHVERLIEVLYKADALWHIVPHYKQVLQILKDNK